MTVILSVVLLAFCVGAADEGDLTFKLNGNSYTVTGCAPSAEGDISIPATYNGKPVTAIADSAFLECMGITGVVIPDTVVTIGDYAFFYCSGMKNIAISESVESIGSRTFELCDALESITVDPDNKYFSSDEYGVLFNKEKTVLIQYPIGNTRSSYTIPYGVISLDYSAFADSTLSSISIPETVTTIGDWVFNDCRELTSINIPHSVTSIGEDAFSNCNSISEFDLPDSLLSIEAYAFFGCKIRGIEIPKSVTSIDARAFEKADLLSAITVDEDNKNYSNDENGVLYNKDKTELVKYPEGNKSKTYTIPGSVTMINSDAFNDAEWLESIYVDANNKNYSNDSNGILFDKDKTRLIKCPMIKEIESYNVPEGVTVIGDHAFSDCGSLESITIPEGVIKIGDSAFSCCYNLMSVTIPESIKSVGLYAFEWCSILTDIYYGGSEVQWKKIRFDAQNEWLLNANIHFAKDSTEECTHEAFEYFVTEGTCKEYGYTTYTCISCGYTYQSDYVLRKHTAGEPVIENSVKADCVKGGSYDKVSYCLDCGNKVSRKKVAVDALGHKGGTATCTKKAVCTACKQSYGSLKAHDYADATCTAPKTCKVCKATNGSALKHSNTTSTTKATLKKNGKQVTKCTVCGYVSKTTAINKIKSVKLSATTYTYNGKAKTPSVTVKDSKGNTLKKGTDYTVKYSSGRKNPGKYTVTITFKGKYEGTKKLTFTVKPSKGTLSKVTAGSKQLTAAWKTVSGATGYEVVYSTSKKFTKKTTKKVTIKKAKTKKTTIKKLKKGKKYYVKVRAYKTVSGKKIYGAYSSVKSVKIK